MTATTTPTVETPRDRYGRYLIPDPVTGKMVPYTRATTYAKSISDTFGLTKWMLRMAGLGLAQRQDLLLGVAAADPGDNKTLDRIMGEAKDHAGAMSGANIGTALHTFTEQVDRGETPTVPAPWDADVVAYSAALDAAGITIVPEHIEQIVVLPDIEVAGTLDRIVRLPDGRLVIADLKTGKDLSYSMAEISIQLALYANASHIFDPATGELTPMPDVDKNVALVFHLPAGQARCNILTVNIADGQAMFDTVTKVRNWRKRRDLAVPFTVEAAVTPLAAASAVAAPTITRAEWCVQALTSLVDAGHGPTVAADWPAGLLTIGQARHQGIELTDGQYDVMHRLIMDVAGKVGHPFFPQAYPDDDQFVAAVDQRIVTLREQIVLLPADLIERLQTLAAEHGVPKLTSGQARRSDVDRMDGWVEELTAEHTARRTIASAHLGTFPPSLHTQALELAGISDPTRLTHQATERLGALADAFELGIIDNEGDLVASPTAFTDLVARYGGSKKAVIDAAKSVAADLGLARPTSSTQVEASLMLLAATTIQATPTTTNTGDK